jgi:hypothetical protein
MPASSTDTVRDLAALHEKLEAAQARIEELEEKLSTAEQAQQASTVLLVATLVQRLGGEVVLSNAEMGTIAGELQSYDTFGGRVFKLVERQGARPSDGDEPSGD